jgi:hypothetical protein
MSNPTANHYFVDEAGDPILFLSTSEMIPASSWTKIVWEGRAEWSGFAGNGRLRWIG